MNILSRIRDIRPRVKYMMSRIRDNRPMSVKAGTYSCTRRKLMIRKAFFLVISFLVVQDV